MSFEHSGSSMTITMTGSDFPADSSWYVGFCEVNTFLPFITLTGGGMTAEDGSVVLDQDGMGSAASFTATRSGSGKFLEKPLVVKVKEVGADPGESLAVGGADYAPISTFEIGGNAAATTKAVQAMDDDDIEAEVEVIKLQLAPSADYGFGTPPATVTGGVRDDDFEIVGASVSFNSQGITRDDGMTGYAGPHWLDQNNDRIDDHELTTRYGAAGQLGQPISYERSLPVSEHYVTASPSFTVHGNPFGNVTIIGNGDGPGGGVFKGGASVTDLGGGLKVIAGSYTPSPPSLEPTTPLPDHIDNGDLRINWRIETNHNKTLRYGRSRNHIYVTGAYAPGALETVLDIGCRNAKGLKPDGLSGEQAVMDAIWSDFQDPMPGVRNVEDIPMTYWGFQSIQRANGPEALNTAAELVKFLDGQCGAWAGLMVQVLTVQGVSAVEVGIYPPPGPLLPPLDLQGNPLPGGFQIVEVGFTIKPIAGQNSDPAGWRNFSDHAVVKLRSGHNETIYDPSYGTKYAGGAGNDPEAAWEESSVESFTFVYQWTEAGPPPNGLPPSFTHSELNIGGMRVSFTQ